MVEALELATEGWPAGVYLAALAWKASDGPRPLPSGERREIADYLTSEVLADQSADIVRFLTRTAIVSRLCPELCTVLTGPRGQRRSCSRRSSGRTSSSSRSTTIASGTATTTSSESSSRWSSSDGSPAS